jgi:hypothetical protein
MPAFGAVQRPFEIGHPAGRLSDGCLFGAELEACLQRRVVQTIGSSAVEPASLVLRRQIRHLRSMRSETAPAHGPEPIWVPASLSLGRDYRCVANDGDQITLASGFNPQHAEAVLGVSLANSQYNGWHFEDVWLDH